MINSPYRSRAASLPVLAGPSVRPTVALQLNPFLHVGEDRVYNPLTDRMILGYAAHGGELEQDLLPTAPGP